MPISPIVYHGDVSVDLPDVRIRRLWDDLDEYSGQFQRATEDAFAVGDAWPGLSGVTIRELTVTVEVPDEVYLFDLRGVGTGPGARRLDYQEQAVEEGFDTASVVFLTNTKNYLRLGQVMGSVTGLTGPAMFCVGVTARRHPQSSSHWYVTGEFKGLLGEKPEKVRWNSAGRELSKDNLVAGVTGGWDTPRPSEILWGRQSMSISYISTSVPTGTIVPEQTGGAPHPLAPNVFDPVLSGPAADFTWHWPNGWTRSGIDCEVIAGTTMCFVSEQWVYNPKVTF